MIKNLCLVFLILLLTASSCSKQSKELTRWCDELPRAAYSSFEKLNYSDNWFEVYKVQDSIYAIYEPYQWQEVISYLIIGNEFALLFDTGNGIGDIEKLVTSITQLPIRVLNSHSHYDHVGGNKSFDFIYGMDTEFTALRKKGLSHEQVEEEVSSQALCKPLPEGVNASEHRVHAYEIAEYVSEGYTIDLGNRILEVISIPGHTPDAIGLWDKENGLLWTGDTFYQGTIWLFAQETNLKDYKKSIRRLAEMSSLLKYLLPAHNTPLVDPAMVVELDEALAKIEKGVLIGVDSTNGRIHYSFENFTILMGKN